MYKKGKIYIFLVTTRHDQTGEIRFVINHWIRVDFTKGRIGFDVHKRTKQKKLSLPHLRHAVP